MDQQPLDLRSSGASYAAACRAARSTRMTTSPSIRSGTSRPLLPWRLSSAAGGGQSRCGDARDFPSTGNRCYATFRSRPPVSRKLQSRDATARLQQREPQHVGRPILAAEAALSARISSSPTNDSESVAPAAPAAASSARAVPRARAGSRPLPRVRFAEINRTSSLVGGNDLADERMAHDVGLVQRTMPTSADAAEQRVRVDQSAATPRGKSICVTSPLTIIFEPLPSRVRNIFSCSRVAFCASSRMT